MKQNLLFNQLTTMPKRLAMVLTMLFTLGVGSMWGETATYTLSTSDNGKTVTTGDVQWTIAASAIESSSSKCKLTGTITVSLPTGATLNSVALVSNGNGWGSDATITFKTGTTTLNTFSSCSTFTLTKNKTDLTYSFVKSGTPSKNAWVKSITVNYTAAPSCSVKPTVDNALQSVTVTENSIKATIPILAVGGCNITENGLVYSTTNSTPTVGGSGCVKVTTTACGSTAANKTVTITGLNCGTSYYIRGYATNEAGTSYTNVTTKSTSDCPKYTVTFHTSATTTEKIEETSAGDGVTPPSMEEECGDWTFLGWSESYSDSETSTTELELVTLTDGKYYPTDNVNLFPVYTKTTSTGGTAFDKYTQVSLGGTITSGKYLISTGSYTMAGNGKTGANVSPGSTEKTAYEYTITVDGSYFTIKGPDEKYVGGNDGTSLAFGTTVADDSYRWKYVNSGIQNKLYTTRHIKAFGTSDFRHYTTSNGITTYLYKRTEKTSGSTYYYSYPQCTTEATVTLDLNGGSFDPKPDGWEEDGNNYTKTVNSGDQVTLPEPNKTGHDFEGWYNVSTKVTSPYILTGNTTLTAHWTPQTYDITYQDKGDVAFSGTHENNHPTQHTYGTATTLKSATKSGYNFLGWFTTSDCSGSAITQLGATAYTSNITLYAKWEEIPTTCTITYDANGGTGTAPTDNTEYTNGATVTVVGNYGKLTKDGYAFTGWNTESNGSGTPYNAGDKFVITTNTTLHAQWCKAHWILVTDDSKIKDDTRIVIAAKDYDYALSTTQNTYNRGQAEITKTYNTISFTNDVQVIALEKGSIDNTFAFNTGNGYLYAAGANSNNYLKTQNEKDSKGLWEFAIDPTVTAVAVTPTANITRNVLKYNTIGLFSCYESTSTQKDVVIYQEVCVEDQYNVTSNLTNATAKTNPTTVAADAKSLTLNYSANTNYLLPETIIVKMGGALLVATTDYTWDKATGTLTINVTGFYGDIDVKIVAEADPCYQFEMSEVTATSTTNSITLTWTDVAGATGYKVRLDEGEFTTATGLTHTFTGLSPKTTYNWEVQAVNAICEDSKTGSTATQKETFTVSWSVNGNVTSTESVVDGEPIKTTPSDPDDETLEDCGANKFMGWSEKSAGSTPQDAAYYDDLCSAADMKSNHTSVTGDKTFYAVFADVEGGETTYEKVTTISEGTYLMATTTADQYKTKSTLAYTGKTADNRGGVTAVTITNGVIGVKPELAKEITVTLGTEDDANYFAMFDGEYYITQTEKNKFTFASEVSYEWSLNANGQIKQKSVYDGKDDIRIYMNNGNSGSQTEYFCPYAAKSEGNNSGTYYYHAYLFKKIGGMSYSNYVTQCCTSWTAPTLTYTTPLEENGTAMPQLGAGTTHGTVTYASSNPSILSVNSTTGEISAQAPGTATVTATWSGDETYCSVSSTSNVITVKGSFSVIFEANGGTGTMANQKADENNNIAQLNANQFTRTGYVFVGWNTSTSGTGTAYIDQQTNITLTQNLTLYAQWAPVVTLNDAGNEETAHPTAVNGTITLPAGANACDPYEFVGWTAVATGDWNEGINEPALVATTYTPNAPTTLYAVYKIQSEGNPNAFKLSFEGSNGKTYYVGEYGSSPYLRGFSNITKEQAVTFIRTKMYPNDDTKYYLYLEYKEEYLYCYSSDLYTTSSTPSEAQGWVFHTVGDKIQLQAINQSRYLSFSDRDGETINITTHATGSQESFNMLPAVTSTYVAAPLCNQEITITFETGNGDFVANAPATNPLTVSRGDVITLPTCEYPGYEFMGWMKDEQQLDPSDIIGTYYTGDYTVDGVSSTITFYAYYKAIPEEVEFTGKDDVELLMYYYDGTANYYYASSLDGGNGELPSMQNCFNATTWTFTNVGNMQYHIQDETGKYLGAVNDNDNDLSLSNTPKVWNFTLVNGLWKMVCEDSPSRALMYISTGKKFANAAITNEGNGAYSYVTLGICPYPTYTTNPVLSQGFSITNTAMVTSASGQKVKATSALTLETRNIELPCTFTIAAPNITFYDNTGAEVTPLKLTASAASEQFELHFAYKPTAENTMEYPIVTITDDEMKTYTIKNRIYARSLPAVFVIAAKTGNSWVALNANITSTGTQAAPLIMVDNIALPTKATITPNTTKYQLLGLQTDIPSNANSRFKNNGAAIHLYSTNVSKVISASTSTDNKKTYINADAAHDDAASSSNCLFYEWQLQTNDLVHYTLVNSNTTNTSNTKLGYSATYAQWGMYQTGNNVIQEVLLLPIEKDITEMDVEVMEWGTNSMALRFGSEAPATVDITLGATTTKGLSLVNLNSGNTSDIYKVEGLSLAGNDCEALLITDATDASKGKLIRKPILVNGDKNGSDYTIAPTRDVCMHSDIVILNGGKLTADEAKTVGSHVDFANIYVYPGGKLVLDGKSLGVKRQVYLRGGYSWLNQSSYALPEVYLNGDINFNGSGNIIYDYYIQNYKYYQFALPYNVQLAKVTDEAGIDNFPVWVKHYNGALRAADAYATSWEWYPSEEGDANAYFKEGEGYIIAAKPRQVGNTANRPLSIIRFPLGNKVFNEMNGLESDLSITTKAHGIDDYKAGTVTANNVGWNFVGNPFLSTWKGDIGYEQLTKHPNEANWDGTYDWVDAGIKYITIMSAESGSDYAQYIASKTELKPFFPFYLQETANGGSGTINFATAHRVKKAPAVWNVVQEEHEAYVQIEIATDAVADQTGVFVGNKYSDDLDFDDYEKMFGTSTDLPKLWIMHDDKRMAFEAMSELKASNATPLGYRAAQEGKYLFDINLDASQLNEVEAIYLTDNETGVTFDLMMGAYEFESSAITYNDTRFLLRIVMKNEDVNEETGIEDIYFNRQQTMKFIHNGIMYIWHDGAIYDATGKQINSLVK